MIIDFGARLHSSFSQQFAQLGRGRAGKWLQQVLAYRKECRMQSKLYPVTDLNVVALLTELENFFKMQGHQVQVLQIGQGHVIQAQKETTFSTLTGQSSAMTIKIMTEPNGTRV